MAIFAEVFRTISAAGLIQTVAREPVLTDEFTDTVYRAHMGFSLIACAIVLAVAHPFAAFMGAPQIALPLQRSEEHTSELQSLMRISYAVFCLQKKTNYNRTITATSPITKLHSSTQHPHI